MVRRSTVLLEILEAWFGGDGVRSTSSSWREPVVLLDVADKDSRELLRSSTFAWLVLFAGVCDVAGESRGFPAQDPSRVT